MKHEYDFVGRSASLRARRWPCTADRRAEDCPPYRQSHKFVFISVHQSWLGIAYGTRVELYDV
jgi:hypothetical protein